MLMISCSEKEMGALDASVFTEPVETKKHLHLVSRSMSCPDAIWQQHIFLVSTISLKWMEWKIHQNDCPKWIGPVF